MFHASWGWQQNCDAQRRNSLKITTRDLRKQRKEMGYNVTGIT
jgi:hypothetical protein